MQRDDTLNPAMLWVSGGERNGKKARRRGKSCAGCHGEAAQEHARRGGALSRV
jgi:sulfur-oxidizing protein SoxA